MPEYPISVSLRADRTYVDALRQIARKRKMVVADLVRECIDSQLGSTISTYLDSYADAERKSVQLTKDGAA